MLWDPSVGGGSDSEVAPGGPSTTYVSYDLESTPAWSQEKKKNYTGSENTRGSIPVHNISKLIFKVLELRLNTL